MLAEVTLNVLHGHRMERAIGCGVQQLGKDQHRKHRSQFRDQNPADECQRQRGQRNLAHGKPAHQAVHHQEQADFREHSE